MFAIWWRSILTKLADWRASRRRKRRGKARLRTAYRLWFEPCEQRIMLAANLDFSGGVLTYAGSTVANNLVVSVSGNSYSFNDTAETISLSPAAVAAGWSGSGTKLATGPASTVTSLMIDLGSGNDKVTLAALGSSLTSVTVDGNAGTDTLLGPNAANTWNLTGSNAGNLQVSGKTVAFTNMESLTGGSQADTFVFQGGSLSGALNGGSAGSDKLDYSEFGSAVTITVTSASSGQHGLAGTAPAIGTFTNVDVVTGSSSSTDKLAFTNTVGLTATITSLNAGSIVTNGRAISFHDVENLQGATNTKNVDKFILRGGILSGTIDGGLDNDTLVGDDLDSTWDVAAGTVSSSVGTQVFIGIENLTGGTQSDTFLMAPAASTTGKLDGGAGSDVLDYSAWSSPITVTLGSTGPLDSFQGTAPGTGGITNIDLVKGGAGMDTIARTLNANTWSLTSTNSGSVTGNNRTMAFASLETVKGGTGADTLSLAAWASPATIALAGLGTMNGFTGTVAALGGVFDNVNAVVGGAAGSTLLGLNVPATWTVNGTGAGTMAASGRTLTFSSTENLLAGSAADSFLMKNGGSAAGTVDGGAGNDVLNFSALSTAVTVTLTGTGDVDGFAGTAGTALGGSFSNINVLTGSPKADALVGAALANAWTITSTNSGTVMGGGQTLAFSAIENLIGGAASDTFGFTSAGRVTGNVDGGSAGSDVLDFSGLASPVTVSLLGTGTLRSASGTATRGLGGKFDNIETVVATTILKAPTTAGISSSANPALLGEAVDFTVAVAVDSPGVGTPSGPITFFEGATVLGTGTLSNGTVTFTAAGLSLGNHEFIAVYGGDAYYAEHTSAVWTQVMKQGTVISLAASTSETVYGETITFSATVTGVTATLPTGEATFLNGTTVLGSASVAGSGVAVFATALLSVADSPHAVTAVYGGDSLSFGSTATPVAQTISEDTTSIVVTAPASSSLFGEPVPFTVTVLPGNGVGVATGAITLYDGAKTLGTALLDEGGVAVFTTAVLDVAGSPHAIRAVYDGDANFLGSESVEVVQTITPAPTTIALSSANPAIEGHPITLTATVLAVSPGMGAPGGTVTFLKGTLSLGTGTLDENGRATLTTSVLGVPGSPHTLTALYAAADNFLGGTSAVYLQTVNQNLTVTTVTPMASTRFGEPVTFTASVSPLDGYGTATGPVAFLAGEVPLGTAVLVDGVATLTTAVLDLPGSPHTVSAVYEGDINFFGSTSASVLHTITQDGTTTIVTSSANPAAETAEITFVVTVYPVYGASTPTGVVLFLDGAEPIPDGEVELDGGTATFMLTTLGPGDHSIQAVYGGDDNNLPATSAVFLQAVRQATTTTLTSSAAQSLFGQTVSFTATITSSTGTVSPTGTVTFLSGTSVLGTAALDTGGAAVLETSILSVPGAPHVITAVYGGDGNSFGSTSQAALQTVSRDGTTTVLTSWGEPAPAGAAVAYTATVTAANGYVPSGTVTFKSGTTTLGTAKLVDGVAVLTKHLMSIRTHTLRAIYGGDANFTGSTTAGYFQNVIVDGTTAAITNVSPEPSYPGQPIAIVVQVSSQSGYLPTGVVSFKSGSTLLGTAALKGGVATLTKTVTALGTHVLSAVYGGASGYASSTAVAVEHVVSMADTTTVVTANANPARPGQVVIFTATVSSDRGIPRGTVIFQDGTTTLATRTLSAKGQATFTLSTLAETPYTITAVYSGNAGFNASAATTGYVQEVLKADTSITVSANVDASWPGQTVTILAQVASDRGTPNGTVTFFDGTVTLGTATLSGGVAKVSRSLKGLGMHTLTAVYGGSTGFVGSNAAAYEHTVSQLAPASFTISSTPNPAAPTQFAVFTVDLTGSGPALGGTVTFRNGTTTLGSKALSGGTASLTVAPLAAGTHTITVIYGGSTIYAATTSAEYFQVVSNPTLTAAVSLSASPNPSAPGQKVTFTATVSAAAGNGMPSGFVFFNNGATQLAKAALDGNGQATFSTASLAAGSHSITVFYGGDGDFFSSISTVRVQTVTSGSGTDDPGEVTPPSNPNYLDVANGLLTYTGSSVANGLTISFSNGVYTLTDLGEVIVLSFGAQAAGWSGSGSTSVKGPAAVVTDLIIDLGEGDDRVTVLSLDPNLASLMIDGGTGADTLVGPQAANVWNVTGSNAGTMQVSGKTVAFTNTESLTGGNQSDTFVFQGGAVSGTINGGSAGSDLLDYSALDVPILVTVTSSVDGTHGLKGSAPGIGASFTNIDALLSGTSADDTLAFANTLGLVATITATNAGSVAIRGRTLAFSAIENLQGATHTKNQDTFILSGGVLTGVIDGGLDNDILIGGNVATTWNVSGSNSGTVVSSFGTQVFAGIESLTGGTASDTFVIAAGASLAGKLDGGSGNDLIDYSGWTSDVVITLGSVGTKDSFQGAASATGGIINIDRVMGGSGSDTVTRTNISNTNTWTLTSANAGSVVVSGTGGYTFRFASVENLIGSSVKDTLDLAALPEPIQVTLTGAGTKDGFQGIASGLKGSFDNMDVLAAGAGSADLLTGPDLAATWTINGVNAGTLATSAPSRTLAFSAFENLTGGSEDDSFNFKTTGSVAGNVIGGEGVDTLNFSALTAALNVRLLDAGWDDGFWGTSNYGIGGTFDDIDAVKGGSSSSDRLTAANLSNLWVISASNAGVLNGDDIPLSFSSFEHLGGGSEDDVFQLAGGKVTGSVDGGLGIDYLVANNTNNTWTIKGANSGAVTSVAAFANIENLIGGSGNDVFTFTTAGSISDSIDGGGGGDTLDFTGLKTTVTSASLGGGTVDGTAAVPSTGVGGYFDNVDVLRGSTLTEPLMLLSSPLPAPLDGPSSMSLSSSSSGYSPPRLMVVVDFREITFFDRQTVIGSSDAAVRSASGLTDPFDPNDPAQWPYDPSGGSGKTKSRGTDFRIYGFAAGTVGQTVADADNPSITYIVQADPAIAGAYYVDLGGPRRVNVPVDMLQIQLIDNRRVKPFHLTGTTKLTAEQRNVPGIMLNHNVELLTIPKSVRDQLALAGTPLVDPVTGQPVTKGLVDFVTFQLYGHGSARFREFVDVEVTVVDPYGGPAFQTAKNHDFEGFNRDLYRFYNPQSDASRFNDPWKGTTAGAGTDNAANLKPRIDYAMPTDAIQLLPTVNTHDDTARIYLGPIRALGSTPVAEDDLFNIVVGETFTVNAPGVLANDSSGSGNPMTTTLVVGPSHYATFSLSSDGSFIYEPLPGYVGSDTFTYYATDGATNSNVATVTIVVAQAATTTSLDSSPNSSVFGQHVTFTATVQVNLPGTGTPTGTITFLEGTLTLGTWTLSGGTATFTTNTLSVGTHTITAVYSGDSSFLGSTSVPYVQTVTPDNTVWIVVPLTPQPVNPTNGVPDSHQDWAPAARSSGTLSPVALAQEEESLVTGTYVFENTGSYTIDTLQITGTNGPLTFTLIVSGSVNFHVEQAGADLNGRLDMSYFSLDQGGTVSFQFEQWNGGSPILSTTGTHTFSLHQSVGDPGNPLHWYGRNWLPIVMDLSAAQGFDLECFTWDTLDVEESGSDSFTFYETGTKVLTQDGLALVNDGISGDNRRESYSNDGTATYVFNLEGSGAFSLRESGGGSASSMSLDSVVYGQSGSNSFSYQETAGRFPTGTSVSLSDSIAAVSSISGFSKTDAFSYSGIATSVFDLHGVGSYQLDAEGSLASNAWNLASVGYSEDGAGTFAYHEESVRNVSGARSTSTNNGGSTGYGDGGTGATAYAGSDHFSATSSEGYDYTGVATAVFDQSGTVSYALGEEGAWANDSLALDTITYDQESDSTFVLAHDEVQSRTGSASNTTSHSGQGDYGFEGPVEAGYGSMGTYSFNRNTNSSNTSSDSYSYSSTATIVVVQEGETGNTLHEQGSSVGGTLSLHSISFYQAGISSFVRAEVEVQGRNGSTYGTGEESESSPTGDGGNAGYDYDDPGSEGVDDEGTYTYGSLANTGEQNGSYFSYSYNASALRIYAEEGQTSYVLFSAGTATNGSSNLVSYNLDQRGLVDYIRHEEIGENYNGIAVATFIDNGGDAFEYGSTDSTGIANDVDFDRLSEILSDSSSYSWASTFVSNSAYGGHVTKTFDAIGAVSYVLYQAGSFVSNAISLSCYSFDQFTSGTLVTHKESVQSFSGFVISSSEEHSLTTQSYQSNSSDSDTEDELEDFDGAGTYTDGGSESMAYAAGDSYNRTSNSSYSYSGTETTIYDMLYASTALVQRRGTYANASYSLSSYSLYEQSLSSFGLDRQSSQHQEGGEAESYNSTQPSNSTHVSESGSNYLIEADFDLSVDTSSGSDGGTFVQVDGFTVTEGSSSSNTFTSDMEFRVEKSGTATTTRRQFGSYAQGSFNLPCISLDQENLSVFTTSQTSTRSESGTAVSTSGGTNLGSVGSTNTSMWFNSRIEDDGFGSLSSFASGGTDDWSTNNLSCYTWFNGQTYAFNSTATATLEQSGMASHILHQEGMYANGSVSLSCVVLDRTNTSHNHSTQELSESRSGVAVASFTTTNSNSNFTSSTNTYGYLESVEFGMFDEDSSGSGNSHNSNLDSYTSTSNGFTGYGFSNTILSSTDRTATSSVHLHVEGTYANQRMSFGTITLDQNGTDSFVSVNTTILTNTGTTSSSSGEGGLISYQFGNNEASLFVNLEPDRLGGSDGSTTGYLGGSTQSTVDSYSSFQGETYTYTSSDTIYSSREGLSTYTLHQEGSSTGNGLNLSSISYDRQSTASFTLTRDYLSESVGTSVSSYTSNSGALDTSSSTDSSSYAGSSTFDIEEETWGGGSSATSASDNGYGSSANRLSVVSFTSHYSFSLIRFGDDANEQHYRGSYSGGSLALNSISSNQTVTEFNFYDEHNDRTETGVRTSLSIGTGLATVTGGSLNTSNSFSFSDDEGASLESLVAASLATSGNLSTSSYGWRDYENSNFTRTAFSDLSRDSVSSFHLYQAGSYSGGSLSLGCVNLDRESTSTFTSHGESYDLQVNSLAVNSFVSENRETRSSGSNATTGQLNAALLGLLSSTDLSLGSSSSNRRSESTSTTTSLATFIYNSLSSLSWDMDGSSSARLHAQGSYSNGSLSLGTLVADRSSTNHTVSNSSMTQSDSGNRVNTSTGHTLETFVSGSLNTHSLASSEDNITSTDTMNALTVGAASSSGLDSVTWDNQSAESYTHFLYTSTNFSSRETMTLHQEGHYSHHSISLNCINYDKRGTANNRTEEVNRDEVTGSTSTESYTRHHEEFSIDGSVGTNSFLSNRWSEDTYLDRTLSSTGSFTKNRPTFSQSDEHTFSTFSRASLESTTNVDTASTSMHRHQEGSYSVGSLSLSCTVLDLTTTKSFTSGQFSLQTQSGTTSGSWSGSGVATLTDFVGSSAGDSYTEIDLDDGHELSYTSANTGSMTFEDVTSASWGHTESFSFINSQITTSNQFAISTVSLYQAGTYANNRLTLEVILYDRSDTCDTSSSEYEYTFESGLSGDSYSNSSSNIGHKGTASSSDSVLTTTDDEAQDNLDGVATEASSEFNTSLRGASSTSSGTSVSGFARERSTLTTAGSTGTAEIELEGSYVNNRFTFDFIRYDKTSLGSFSFEQNSDELETGLSTATAGATSLATIGNGSDRTFRYDGFLSADVDEYKFDEAVNTWSQGSLRSASSWHEESSGFTNSYKSNSKEFGLSTYVLHQSGSYESNSLSLTSVSVDNDSSSTFSSLETITRLKNSGSAFDSFSTTDTGSFTANNVDNHGTDILNEIGLTTFAWSAGHGGEDFSVGSFLNTQSGLSSYGALESYTAIASDSGSDSQRMRAAGSYGSGSFSVDSISLLQSSTGSSSFTEQRSYTESGVVNSLATRTQFNTAGNGTIEGEEEFVVDSSLGIFYTGSGYQDSTGQQGTTTSTFFSSGASTYASNLSTTHSRTATSTYSLTQTGSYLPGVKLALNAVLDDQSSSSFVNAEQTSRSASGFALTTFTTESASTIGYSHNETDDDGSEYDGYASSESMTWGSTTGASQGQADTDLYIFSSTQSSTYDTRGASTYRLYEVGAEAGHSFSLTCISLNRSDTASFTQQQFSESTHTGVKATGDSAGEGITIGAQSQDVTLYGGFLFADVYGQNSNISNLSSTYNGETVSYVRHNSYRNDRSGSSTYTLYEAGVYSNNSLSLGCIVLNQSSTNSFASTETSVESQGRLAVDSVSYESRGTFAEYNFAPGVGTYVYDGSDLYRFDSYAADSFTSTNTMVYRESGHSVSALYEEGSYSGSSLALSCYSLLRGSSSSFSQHESSSELNSSTAANTITHEGTDTHVFDTDVSVSTYSSVSTFGFNTNNGSVSTRDTGSYQSSTLRQLGTFGGESFNLSSITYQQDSRDSFTAHSESSWTNTGGGSGGGNNSRDESSTSTRSWFAAGSYSNNNLGLSSYVYREERNTNFTSHSESTLTTSTATESHVQDSVSASTLNVFQAGSYGNNSFSLNSYSLLDSSSNSYSMHQLDSFTSNSDTKFSTRDEMSQDSTTLTAVGSFVSGGLRVAYQRDESSLMSMARHAKDDHVGSGSSTMTSVLDESSTSSMTRHEQGSFANGSLSLSSYSYRKGSAESSNTQQTTYNSEFTYQRDQEKSERQLRVESGSGTVGSATETYHLTEDVRVHVQDGDSSASWNYDPSVQSVTRSSSETFTLNRPASDMRLVLQVPEGIHTPHRSTDLEESIQELSGGMDIKGMVAEVKYHMVELRYEAEDLGSMVLGTVDRMAAKPAGGLRGVDTNVEGLLDARALAKWGEEVRSADVFMVEGQAGALIAGAATLASTPTWTGGDLDGALVQGQRAVFTMLGWEEPSRTATLTTEGGTDTSDIQPPRAIGPEVMDGQQEEQVIDDYDSQRAQDNADANRAQAEREQREQEREARYQQRDRERQALNEEIGKAPEDVQLELLAYREAARDGSGTELLLQASPALRAHLKQHGTAAERELLGDEDRMRSALAASVMGLDDNPQLRGQVVAFRQALANVSEEERLLKVRDLIGENDALRDYLRDKGWDEEQVLISELDEQDKPLNKLMEAVEQRLEKIGMQGQSIWDNPIAFFGIAGNEVGEFLKGIGSGFLNGLTGVLSNLVQGLKSIGSAVAGAAKWFYKNVVVRAANYLTDPVGQFARDKASLESAIAKLRTLERAVVELKENGREIFAALITDDVPTLLRIARNVMVFMVPAKDMVLEIATGIIQMTATQKGEIVGEFIYDIAESAVITVVTAGAGAGAVVVTKLMKVQKYFTKVQTLVKRIEKFGAVISGGLTAFIDYGKKLVHVMEAQYALQERLDTLVREAEEAALNAGKALTEAVRWRQVAQDAMDAVMTASEMLDIATARVQAQKASEASWNAASEAEKAWGFARIALSAYRRTRLADAEDAAGRAVERAMDADDVVRDARQLARDARQMADAIIAADQERRTERASRMAAASAGAGKMSEYLACFTGDTPMLTPSGYKQIDQLKEGDLLLARAEKLPNGPVEPRPVEELFTRAARVIHLHVGGQVIRTTKEHPFWVKGKGWVACVDLEIGDLLNSHDGQWMPVEDLFDTDEYAVVYNVQVEGHHTYFVGEQEWGFSVWAHNATRSRSSRTRVRSKGTGRKRSPGQSGRSERASTHGQRRPRTVTKSRRVTPAAVNAPFVRKGLNPPYHVGGADVRRFTTGRPLDFVRVHGVGNQAGQFVVRAKEITGMTAQQIQQHLALPYVPVYISNVHVPAGTPMQMGRVGPQPSWGVPNPGGIQYQLLGPIARSNFRNRRRL